MDSEKTPSFGSCHVSHSSPANCTFYYAANTIPKATNNALMIIKDHSDRPTSRIYNILFWDDVTVTVRNKWIPERDFFGIV